MSSLIKPLQALLRSGGTVWSIDDLRVLWHTKSAKELNDKIRYYTRTQQMVRLRKGIYALDTEFDPYALAQVLVRPSYISLHTALQHHGVVFQFSETITCIAPYPRTIQLQGREYRYHQMGLPHLACPIGIEKIKEFSLASPERALCDALYLGFEPETEQYHRWNTALLKSLLQEFSEPRVFKGLTKRQLFS